MKNMIDEIVKEKVFVYKIKDSLFCLSGEIQCEIKGNDELNAMFKLYEDITKHREENQLILHENQKIKLRKAYRYLMNKAKEIENANSTIETKNDVCNHKYKKYLSNLNEEDIKEINKQLEMKNFVEVYLIQIFGEEYISDSNN